MTPVDEFDRCDRWRYGKPAVFAAGAVMWAGAFAWLWGQL